MTTEERLEKINSIQVDPKDANSGVLKVVRQLVEICREQQEQIEDLQSEIKHCGMKLTG